MKSIRFYFYFFIYEVSFQQQNNLPTCLTDERCSTQTFAK